KQIARLDHHLAAGPRAMPLSDAQLVRRVPEETQMRHAGTHARHILEVDGNDIIGHESRACSYQRVRECGFAMPLGSEKGHCPAIHLYGAAMQTERSGSIHGS